MIHVEQHRAWLEDRDPQSLNRREVREFCAEWSKGASNEPKYTVIDVRPSQVPRFGRLSAKGYVHEPTATEQLANVLGQTSPNNPNGKSVESGPDAESRFARVVANSEEPIGDTMATVVDELVRRDRIALLQAAEIERLQTERDDAIVAALLLAEENAQLRQDKALAEFQNEQTGLAWNALANVKKNLEDEIERLKALLKEENSTRAIATRKEAEADEKLALANKLLADARTEIDEMFALAEAMCNAEVVKTMTGQDEIRRKLHYVVQLSAATYMQTRHTHQEVLFVQDQNAELLRQNRIVLEILDLYGPVLRNIKFEVDALKMNTSSYIGFSKATFAIVAKNLELSGMQADTMHAMLPVVWKLLNNSSELHQKFDQQFNWKTKLKGIAVGAAVGSVVRAIVFSALRACTYQDY